MLKPWKAIFQVIVFPQQSYLTLICKKPKIMNFSVTKIMDFQSFSIVLLRPKLSYNKVSAYFSFTFNKKKKRLRIYKKIILKPKIEQRSTFRENLLYP